MAERVADSVRRLRIKFSGHDFPEATVEFFGEVRNTGLDLEALKKALLSEPLKK